MYTGPALIRRVGANIIFTVVTSAIAPLSWTIGIFVLSSEYFHRFLSFFSLLPYSFALSITSGYQNPQRFALKANVERIHGARLA